MKLQIKQVFILATLAAALLGSVTIGAAIMSRKGSELADEAAARRYRSYLLADELRQSSDDLTRLARTFVVSGDAKWEKCAFH